ncbi:hypothetical protein AcW1_002593 [Taiwanofungus camphoratus]|nr:hypothetical protein AcV7_002118 [Antrodia cinnamomea]KAI0943431.1 hypothetical protein AcW1_002593 [Antrodia cinnamomea]
MSAKPAVQERGSFNTHRHNSQRHRPGSSRSAPSSFETRVHVTREQEECINAALLLPHGQLRHLVDPLRTSLVITKHRGSENSVFRQSIFNQGLSAQDRFLFVSSDVGICKPEDQLRDIEDITR